MSRTSLTKRGTPRRQRKVNDRRDFPRKLSWEPVAGIDVAKRNFNVCILKPLSSDDGKPTVKKHHRTFQRTEDGLVEAVDYLVNQDVNCCVMESTSVYHQIIYQYIAQANIEVFVVNPYLINPRSRTASKRDKLDAHRLAEKLLYGDLSKDGTYKPSYIPTEIEHKLRRTTRLRDKTTATITTVKNRIHKLFDRYAIPLKKHLGPSTTARWFVCLEAIATDESTDTFLERLKTDSSIHGSTRAAIEKHEELTSQFFQLAQNNFDTTDRIILCSLLSQLKLHQQTREELDAEIETLITRITPALERLRQIAKSLPGVSDTLAIRIAIEYGDPYRFSNRRKASSYTGLDVTIRSSGGKASLRGVSKTGNKHLRRHLFLAAERAVQYDTKFRSFYMRLRYKRKLKHTQAICAVARKIGVLYYSLAKHDKEYELLNNRWKAPHKADWE